MTGFQNSIKTYLRNAFDVASKAKSHIVLALMIFSVSLAAGAVMNERFAGLLDVLIPFAENLKDKSTTAIIFGLFRKNALAMLIMMIGGMAFGIIPILSLTMNGAMMGVAMMTGFQRGLSVLDFLLVVVPHGIFELTAVFIAGGVAMRIGFIQFRREGRAPVRTRVSEGIQVLVFIVFPLLLVAAVIEGLGIAQLR